MRGCAGHPAPNVAASNQACINHSLNQLEIARLAIKGRSYRSGSHGFTRTLISTVSAFASAAWSSSLRVGTVGLPNRISTYFDMMMSRWLDDEVVASNQQTDIYYHPVSDGQISAA